MNIVISKLHYSHPAPVFARGLNGIFISLHDLVDSSLQTAMSRSDLSEQQTEAIIAGYIMAKFGQLNDDIFSVKGIRAENIKRFLSNQNKFVVAAPYVYSAYRKHPTMYPACKEALDKTQRFPPDYRVSPEQVLCIWLGINAAKGGDK
ncbi:hypothetical protein ACRTC3_16440 [Photobacterium damselae]|uniref:hypothetical protein n=1 Tax=Photobacterium damselae TaxID=38293 RepID=UPI003D7E07F3